MRLIAALTLIFALLATVAPPASAEPGLGEAAPALVAQDLDGNPVNLAELNAAGKFVMLDFWASWCGPCMRELPHVAPFYDEFAPGRFALVGISLDTDSTEQKMHEAIADLGLHYPIVYEGGGWQTRLAVEWDVHSIPATFLVNPDGVIVLKNIRGEEGLALVKKIVEDAPGFLPPDIEVSAVLEDGEVRGWADLHKLPPGAHKFVFSIAYFRPPAAEGESGEWLGGEYELALTPEDSGYRIAVTPSAENEGELPVNAALEDGVLSVSLEVGDGVETGYFGLSYFAPELEAAISVGSTYARAPEEEPAAE